VDGEICSHFFEGNVSAGNLYRAGFESKLAANWQSTPDCGRITDRGRLGAGAECTSSATSSTTSRPQSLRLAHARRGLQQRFRRVGAPAEDPAALAGDNGESGAVRSLCEENPDRCQTRLAQGVARLPDHQQRPRCYLFPGTILLLTRCQRIFELCPDKRYDSAIFPTYFLTKASTKISTPKDAEKRKRLRRKGVNKTHS